LGTFLSVVLYISYAIFLVRIAWRIRLLAREQFLPTNSRKSTLRGRVLTGVKTVRDILLLSRLFWSNPCLWWGEWLFHAAFVFTMVRHLRYVMQPAPAWLASYQTFGICSGYVLAASLLFIIIYKISAIRTQYVSRYNYFILSLVFIISLSGILMTTVLKIDVTSAKYFMLGALTFHPVSSPESITFSIHFVTSMLLLIFIPTHIFSAPFTLIEARKRDEALRLVMHEK